MTQQGSPPPQKPLGKYAKIAVGAYVVVVPIILIYLVFELWPTPTASGWSYQDTSTGYGLQMAGQATSTTVSSTSTDSAPTSTPAVSPEATPTIPTTTSTPIITPIATTTIPIATSTPIVSPVATTSIPTTTSTPAITPGATTTIPGIIPATTTATTTPIIGEIETLIKDIGKLRIFGTFEFSPSDEQRLLLLVVVMAALGIHVMSAASSAAALKKGLMTQQWVVTSVLRIPIGVGLAVIVYFALRAALISSDASFSSVNASGFAAVAGLVGLMSSRVSDSLEELAHKSFGSVHLHWWFRRKHPNPVPRVVRVHPTDFVAGGDETLMSVMGQGFVSDSKVSYRGKEIPTTLISPDQLTVRITKADIAAPDPKAELIVVNPPPGGGSSPNPVTVSVNPKAS